ncbi:MAG: DUF2764 family protein [Bacteroidales bacterium]|nr:DUF2764 family protein [Bacteroidales bacterium]MBR4974718.1 DUF2764 family protein [Bacteroidales bacterium]
MDNYHYIIAGLPELIPDLGNQQISYADVSERIISNLSSKDRQLVKWFEFGSKPENLNPHFYNNVTRLKSRFLNEYFSLDRNIRNAQVRFLAAKESFDESKYTIGDVDTSYEEYPQLLQIFETPNIFERELQLDKFKWNKISDLTMYHYFDMDVILAFLAKAKIVKRWLDLDKESGAKLFEELVNEVRGTFKGINFNSK